MKGLSPSALIGQESVYRQAARRETYQILIWIPAYSIVLDVLPNGNVVMETRSTRENLKEFSLTANAGKPRSLTLGNSTDRQPCYSPDENEIVFSSNRSGNLEIWSISRKDGVPRRLTDDP